jgi:hypothetical protein
MGVADFTGQPAVFIPNKWPFSAKYAENPGFPLSLILYAPLVIVYTLIGKAMITRKQIVQRR